MSDFRVMEVFHNFTDDPYASWDLVGMFGCEPHIAPPDYEEREILIQAIYGLRDRYGEQVESGMAQYAHAAVRFPDRVFFVYLTLLFWPSLDRKEKH